MRKRILTSARKQFLQGGLNSLSMRDIASKVGISAMTIYLYFKNRQAIVMALIEEGLDMLQAQINVHRAIEAPLERLLAMGDAYIDFAFEHPQYYRALFSEVPDPGKETMHDYNLVAGRIVLLMQPLLQAVTEITGTNQGAIAKSTILFCTLHGFVQLTLSDRLRFIGMSTGEIQASFRTYLPRILSDTTT